MGQINKEIVKTQRVMAPVGQIQLKGLIEAHVVRIDPAWNTSYIN